MKKACSAILSLILVLCMGASGGVSVSATDVSARESEPPLLRLSYTHLTRTSLTISGGQATCTGYLLGYNGTTTKVVITLYLERKTASSSTWTVYASDPPQTFNSFTGKYTMKKTVTPGYQYRVRGVYTAYAGTKSETTTAYSAVVSY